METTELLIVGIVCLMFLIIIFIFIYWFLSIRNKNSKPKMQTNNQISSNKTETTNQKKKTHEYTKIPIFDFMEFDKIEDNMIKQNGGKRYLMVVECEGINYDLMSEIEKTSVEAGFVQFLNTLRHPIQIYTQTRTINIGHSIENYNSRITTIKSELDQKQIQLNKTIQSGDYNAERVRKLRSEIARIQNLYDYGRDIVQNIERMSLNKNVLRKHYYIIVPYYTSELGDSDLTEEEKKNMIFSELYTRCQAITRTLFACSMKSRVLTSNELAELLYVAYNRDESEVYGVEKALKAGYTELYSTAQDVLDKRIEALNTAIEKQAIELAQNTVQQIKSEKQKIVEEKEKSFDELVKELAKKIVMENKSYIGKEETEKSIEKIDKKEKIKTKEEGGKNDEKAKTTRRVRKSN